MSRSSSPVVVVHAGAMTPIGLSLPETAASARARVARMREIDWLDRRFQPFVVARVPDAALPPLSPRLGPALGSAALSTREARMLQLAQPALEEALSVVPAEAGRVPLLLGLSEQQPVDAARFLERLDLQCRDRIDFPFSQAVSRGRAGGLMALREAVARLQRGDSDFMLIGGVDCLVDRALLAVLDGEGRIRNPANPDGFSPSEGAAFLLLSLADTARAWQLEPMVQLLGSAQGHESGHLYADEPYLGDGLAETFDNLFAQVPPPRPIASVYCSFNGERYWGREFGVARLRQQRAFVPEQQMEHPAECFGELGAAHGPALMALAAHALQQGYRPAPCLVYASSDHGDRAASLLDLIT